MHFFLAFAMVVLCGFNGSAHDLPDYTTLQKQITALSHLIRVSEDKIIFLDESLLSLKQEQLCLIENITHNRYYATVGLHHMLSRTFYPPVFAFLDKHKSIHDQYYDYRTMRALHEHYQRIMNAQIRQKLILDKKSEQIKHYKYSREMIALSLQNDIEKLKKLRQSQTLLNSDEIAEFQAKINDLKQRHDNLNNFIASVTGMEWKHTPDITVMHGEEHFILPVSGTVIVRFDEHTVIGGRSDGISIKTHAYAPVSSPLSGHVLYAGSFNHLGMVLIIQHQRNLLSVFKGLGDIYAQTGDLIEQNQIVGVLPKENQQKSYNGTVLYYELRYNNIPVDPLDKLS